MAATGPKVAKTIQEAFNESFRLPKAFEIIQAPNSAKLPNNRASTITVLQECSEFWFRCDQQSRENLIKYVNRMDQESREYFYNAVEKDSGQSKSDILNLEFLHERLGLAL